MIDIFMDASCLGHLLRPNISIKNRTINNIIVNIRNHNNGILKIQAPVSLGPIARKKMNEGALTMTNEFLQREAWRTILLSSQRYFSFKILAKYNITKVQGVLCKHTTNKPLAISLLGTDATPVVSNKDPLSKLLINKAHLRQIHSSVKPIHSTASTTLARLMTGTYGVLMVNGEEMIEN